jgi:hypothetical protein
MPECLYQSGMPECLYQSGKYKIRQYEYKLDNKFLLSAKFLVSEILKHATERSVDEAM